MRTAIDYKGIDAPNPYDPDDYMSLINNCIIPYLKDPDTIATTEVQILVGVDSNRNITDPRAVDCEITIIVVVNAKDMKTNVAFLRDDLIEDGIVCETRADYIANEIIVALSDEESKTWIGDISLLSNEEASLNNSAHYARRLSFHVKEVNMGNRGI